MQKKTVKKSSTSSFGVSSRQGHDSSSFYRRNLYHQAQDKTPENLEPNPPSQIPPPAGENWIDHIFNQSSENLPLPDNSAALAFTSPPYNVGKDYDDDMSLDAYLQLISTVGKEIYRVIQPGGRYVINIANLGRKPYIPLHSFFYRIHMEIGFLPMGEIIWQKASGANGNCAWGSWKSAKAPRIRDIHEYLLIFAKEKFGRPDTGPSDLSGEDFMESTLSIWRIPPESARKIGHPAPFPLELATRVIRLYSYVGDVVIDPFCGSGTTCVAARNAGRHYAGFDISAEYCRLAEKRIAESAV